MTGSYVGTASVARDLVEIIDRIDELRSGQSGNSTVGSLGSGYDLDSRNKPGAEVPHIRYIRFSYGTVIGNYFASMFPGRVDYMCLTVC